MTYADNQDVIDLLQRKPDGLFTVMNDLAKINKKDDSVFCNRFIIRIPLLVENLHLLLDRQAQDTKCLVPRVEASFVFVISRAL